MKLPEIHKIGVQSLGRESRAAADAAHAETSLWQSVSEGIDSLVRTGVEIKDKNDRMKAKAHLNNTIHDFSAEYEGKEYISVDDPNLEGVDFDLYDSKGEARSEIPIHEVYSQMFEKKAKNTLKESEGMIKIPASKREFGYQYGESINRDIASSKITAAKQGLKYAKNEQSNILETYAAKDMYGSMYDLINSDEFIGTESERELLLAKTKDTEEKFVKENEFNTYFDQINTEDRAGMTASLQNLQSDKYKGNLDEKGRYTAINYLQGKLTSMDAAAKSAFKVEAKYLKKEMNSVTENMKKGIMPPADYLADLDERMGMYLDAEDRWEIEEYKNALDFASNLNNFTKLPAEVREQQLANVEPTSAQAIEQKERFREAHENAKKEVSNDMMKFASDSGLVGLNEIDFSNPASFAEGIAIRKEQYKGVVGVHGHGQGIFTKEEAAELSRSLELADSQTKFEYIKSINDQMGYDDADLVFDQIGESGYSSFAIAGQTANRGGAPAAQKIVMGADIRKEMPEILGNKKDLTAAIYSKTKTLYGLNGDAQSSFNEAIMDAYAYHAKLDGVTGVYDEKVFNKALNTVTGKDGLVTRNGSSFITPAYGMDEDGFNNWLDRLPDTYFDKSQGGVIGGTSQEMMMNLRDGKYAIDNVGAREYLIRDHNDGRYVMGADGRPLLLRFE